MRKGNWSFGALALVLAFSLAGCSLALPERAASGRDQFVGFHLVREDAGIPPSQRHPDAAWVPVSHPLSDEEYILEGERQTDGTYVFPGLDGLNFFFPTYVDTTWGSGAEEDTAVRLSVSDLESTGLHQNVSDGGTAYSCSGTVYIGPAEEQTGAYWIVRFYPVYQRPDGTVYLTDAAQGVGGTGDVTVSHSAEAAVGLHGGEESQAGLAVSVSVEWTQRLESVTVQQYSGEQILLREDTLTAREAMELDGTWSLPWADGAAYTLAVKRYDGGTEKFELFPESYAEDVSASMMVWFLDEWGMGVPVTVELEREN